MCIQRIGNGTSIFAASALTLAVLFSAWGCGSSSAGSAPAAAGESAAEGGADNGQGGREADAGDSSIGGTTAGSAGEVTGGGGAEGSIECPLDTVGRARAESLAMQFVSESAWILNQTHGSGQFAGRGFGFVLPLTTVASLMSVSLMQDCTEPNLFDKYCPPPEAAGAEASPCSQLECLGPGELRTTLDYEPVPFTAALEPPPGQLSIEKAEQSATFTEQADESIAIEWTTELEVAPHDEQPLTITHTATGEVDGPNDVPMAAGSVSIDGLVPGGQVLKFDYEAGGDEATGIATVDGIEVFSLTHDGFVWIGPCE